MMDRFLKHATIGTAAFDDALQRIVVQPAADDDPQASDGPDVVSIPDIMDRGDEIIRTGRPVRVVWDSAVDEYEPVTRQSINLMTFMLCAHICRMEYVVEASTPQRCEDLRRILAMFRPNPGETPLCFQQIIHFIELMKIQGFFLRR